MSVEKTCPKCGHLSFTEGSGAFECCSECGLYFEKWETRHQFIPSLRSRRLQKDEAIHPWIAELQERLAHIPQTVDATWLYGRGVMLTLFLIWGIRLGMMDYRNGEMASSFMHSILLPFHEAGHVLFIPFGRFLMILGGSLFQLLMPLIVAGTLLWKNRDPFGAALGLWWCGVSLMDLAAYIYDAKDPQLPLLGGHTGADGPHDWIYLLGVLGKIQRAHTCGFIAHKLGFFLMLTALAGAAVVLWRAGKARMH